MYSGYNAKGEATSARRMMVWQSAVVDYVLMSVPSLAPGRWLGLEPGMMPLLLSGPLSLIRQLLIPSNMGVPFNHTLMLSCHAGHCCGSEMLQLSETP